MGTNPIAVAMAQAAQQDLAHKQGLKDQAEAQQKLIRSQGLLGLLQNAKTPEEAGQILSGAVGVYGQPEGQHHLLQGFRNALGRLTGHPAQQAAPEQPPVPMQGDTGSTMPTAAPPGPAAGAPAPGRTFPQPPLSLDATAPFTPVLPSTSQQYTTQLDPQAEAQFQDWVKSNNIPWQDSPTADYDMRGFWKAMQDKDPRAVRSFANKHFPDTWKTPYHASFSNESMYAPPDAPHWQGNQLVDKSGKVVFDEDTQGKPAPGVPQPQASGPAPGGPARPVPPGMKGKQPKPDPAMDLFTKYWRSPAQIADEEDAANLARFNRHLDQLQITDPKERQDAQVEFLRAQFNMKAAPGHPSFKNFRMPDGSIATLDVNAPDFKVPVGSHLETSTRKVPGRILSVDSAKDLAADGEEFKDAKGKKIDLDKLHPWEALQWVSSGSEEYYKVVDQRQRIVGVGNEMTVQPEVGQPQALGTAPNLGPRYPDISRTQTETSPGGGQVVTGTSTISRGGGRGAPAAPVAVPGAPAVIPGAAAAPVVPKGPAPRVPRPGPTGVAPGATPPVTDKSDAAMEQRVKKEGILPGVEGMTQKNAEKTRKQLPSVTAVLGLFGDPRYPGALNMTDFADLADDDHAKRILGRAFQLLHREVGTVTEPGTMATLMNAAGWAKYQADVEAEIQRTTGEAMTPREQDYFMAAIAGMADILGARGATGQSPAKFSVATIQNELPLIGLSSTVNKREYLSKVLTVSKQLDVGLDGMPDKDRAVWWMNKRRKEIQDELDKGPAPGGPMRPVPPAPGGKSATITVSPEDLK